MTIWPVRRFTLIGGVLAACALLVGAPLAQHAGPHWGYEGSNGPDHWGALDKTFEACQAGHAQSPIDIRSAKPADLPAIQFAYQPTPLHIINNGHTIQVNYAPGSFITVGDKRYQLKQFHFHHPSEERIDGKGFAMVAHLVHASDDGKLAVVAVLLDAGSRQPGDRDALAAPAGSRGTGAEAGRREVRRDGIGTDNIQVIQSMIRREEKRREEEENARLAYTNRIRFYALDVGRSFITRHYLAALPE